MEAALRQAVFARPDDDAPRFVYADWLLEQGDPYGRFVAAQLRGQTTEAMAVFNDVKLRASAGASVNPQLKDFERGFMTGLFLSVDARADADVWPLVHTLKMLGASQDAALISEVGSWSKLQRVESRHAAAVNALVATGCGPLALLVIGDLREPVRLGPLVGPHTQVTLRLQQSRWSVTRTPGRLSISITRGLDAHQLRVNVLEQVVRPSEPVTMSVLAGCEAEAQLVRRELERLEAGPVTELPVLMIG